MHPCLTQAKWHHQAGDARALCSAVPAIQAAWHDIKQVFIVMLHSMNLMEVLFFALSGIRLDTLL